MKLDELLKTKVGQLPGNRERLEQAGKSAASGLGGLEVAKPKPHPIPALDPKQIAHGRSKKRVVIVVAIISYRRRELDETNLIAGAKPIQDCIAASLGVDDRDRRIKWEFRQVIGEGPEGTLVMINRK